jgi:hypothetical protein
MDRVFYLPRSVRADWAVRPCIPRSFQTLKVHKLRGIRQANLELGSVLIWNEEF